MNSEEIVGGPSPDRWTELSGLRTQWLVRWTAAILSLEAGLVALSLPKPSSRVWWYPEQFGGYSLNLPLPTRLILVGLTNTGLMAAVFLTWSSWRDQIRETVTNSGAERRWVGYLLIYGLAIVCLVQVANSIASHRIPAELWLPLMAALALSAMMSWCLAAMPARFWFGWVSRNRRVFPAIGVIAIVGYALVFDYTHVVLLSLPAISAHLQRATLWTCALLLRQFSSQVVFEPESQLLGTNAFAIYVAENCAGWQGITIFCVFFGLYLWLQRQRLRFPQVLVLLPAGVVILWMLNCVRIVALILLGNWSESVAMGGFHSISGWLFFDWITLLLIVVSIRLALFAKETERTEPLPSNPGTPYLVPLLAVIAAQTIAKGLFHPFNFLYPLCAAAGAAGLVLYWKRIPPLQSVSSLFPIAVGVGAFMLLLAIDKHNGSTAGDAPMLAGFRSLSVLGAGVWVVFRIVGAVLIAPVSEELAFRGYAMRKLISTDFENVPLTKFTWPSFLGSSLLFGAMHSQWIVETLIGMSFAAAVYRRGLIWDGIMAHGVTNGLLSAYVLTTGHWGLWG